MSTAADILTRILKKRGLSSAQARDEFLNPDYAKLHDPFLLPDMKAAVRRLKKALKQKQKIIIYGDYDVDGLSATSLLSDALGKFGFSVEAFIPDRYKDGYGLNQTALKRLVDGGAQLILTVDTGSTAVEEIKQLGLLGVDVIVTDHHEPPAVLPPAVAIINPKRTDSRYPNGELAGTGVAFKLVCALQSELDGLDKGQEKWLLDLVALGTVCDVVPLTGENRILAAYGLRVLAQSRRPGIKALAEVSDTDLRTASAYHLGFVLGPRLNAAGRLEHANLSLQLLTSQNLDEARPLALELDRLNSKRQLEQRAIEQQAESMIAIKKSQPVLVLAHEGWSQGIVGIVAARLLERYQKPVFLMQIIEEEAKGSARSFGDFDLSRALDEVRDLLLSGGGHKAAAGYRLKYTDVDKFEKKLNNYYGSLKLEDQSRYLAARPDLSLEGLSDMTVQLADALKQLEPFGAGNREPIFELKNLKINQFKRVGQQKQHLKVTLMDSSRNSIQAIAFNCDLDVRTGQNTDVLAKLRRSDFRGWATPELHIADWKLRS